MAQQGNNGNPANGGGQGNGNGAPPGQPPYGVLRVEKMILERDLEDARFLVLELCDVVEATTGSYMVGNKTAFYNWARKHLTPGDDLSERHVRALAKTLGVPTHTINAWVQEFVTTHPGYAVEGRRKLPRQNVAKNVVARLEEATVAVPPRLAKSVQRLVNAQHDVVRDSLQSGNAQRPLAQQVAVDDAKRYSVGNSIRKMAGKRSGPAFQGKR